MDTFNEFMQKKYHATEENHGNLMLKVAEAEKDLQSLKEQVLMCEGFLDYYKRFRNEFAFQEKNVPKSDPRKQESTNVKK